MTIEQLHILAASRRASVRLRCVHTARRLLSDRGKRRGYLELGKKLLRDRSSDVRWQAAILIGEFIEEKPELVWTVTHNCVTNADDDLKDALACVLLEHLLEHHFDVIFPLVEREIVKGNSDLLDVLSRCWPFGQAEGKWPKVNRLLKALPGVV